ncbi:ATP-dependent RNA helicase SUPV3L1/SUV3 [Clostridium sp. DSM 8431]|uniref:SUV3 family DEAD/DEAH box RNA helicase n=1 Tax=Clostridium sp. DSM 8431 TaxID=1761781 RepID=UPI0008F0B9DE|nr:DEAD/DEAH box helicase [Clostridium sp. DSM 8431]SFU38538.1 ATP-dependent RNA helicase SUPV3L1/SUV3 [Clostridium sp. DSM 8431]
MKKNAAHREYKKLKSQINQIEEIVHHSKGGALHEHESTLRKKILLLNEMENEGFKDFEDVSDRYNEALEYVGKRIIEDYNRKNNCDFDYYEVARGNYKVLLNSGILTVLTKKHIPKMISKEFEENFPMNPKDEYREARGMRRKFVIHLGDTNTGKTYNAIERLKTCKNGVYLSPLRILALENYERLNNEGILCDLATGEEEIVHEGSTHMSCTIEKLNLKKQYEVAVIDEIQMIDDSQRGAAWSRAVLGIRAKEIHICGAMNAKYIIETMLKDCRDDYEIHEYKRKIPLVVEENEFNQNDIQDGDAIVLFSKKKVLTLAKEYAERGERASIIYGDLPPEVRRMQYEQFTKGETKLLITTDAIGMGVNLPIRRIIFLSTKKFDGEEIRDLTSQEVKQIAGRAGRIGIYDTGYVTSARNNKFVRDKILEQDREITEAVIGPSDAILRIKTLPLIEKLALWSARKEELDYYRKMDISDYIIVLEKLKSYKLMEEVQWKLLKVPFDVTSDELMEQFLFYVDELFIAKSKTITRPSINSGVLDELEIYYQKINMYYSFNKLFNLKFDFQWIYDERIRVSEEINEILINM